MNDYRYEYGKWTKCDVTCGWDAETESENLDRHGWRALDYDIRQHYDANEIGIYQKFIDYSYRDEYLLDFNFLNSCHWVLVDELPNLLMFLETYAPMLCSGADRAIQLENNDLLKKLFRVYHGHDPLNVCQFCDPVMNAERQSRRA